MCIHRLLFLYLYIYLLLVFSSMFSLPTFFSAIASVFFLFLWIFLFETNCRKSNLAIITPQQIEMLPYDIAWTQQSKSKLLSFAFCFSFSPTFPRCLFFFFFWNCSNGKKSIQVNQAVLVCVACKAKKPIDQRQANWEFAKEATQTNMHSQTYTKHFPTFNFQWKFLIFVLDKLHVHTPLMVIA